LGREAAAWRGIYDDDKGVFEPDEDLLENIISCEKAMSAAAPNQFWHSQK